jgi:phosphonate transport system permease protein
MRPAPPLLVLLPALVLVPVLLMLPQLLHGGGWDLIGQFAWAALTPATDPLVLQSLLRGLGITAGMALLGWALSLLLGLGLGLLSSRLIWHTLSGTAAPAALIRRLLALPRSIHELIWGLLLLQLIGQRPAVAVVAIAIPYGALVARVVSDLLDAPAHPRLGGPAYGRRACRRGPAHRHRPAAAAGGDQLRRLPARVCPAQRHPAGGLRPGRPRQ